MNTSKITLLIIYFQLVSFNPGFSQNQPNKASSDTMLCVGKHWTEEEGKMFLDSMRKTYTTPEAW